MTDEINYPDPDPRVDVDRNAYHDLGLIGCDHGGSEYLSECRLCFALVLEDHIPAHFAAAHPEAVRPLPEPEPYVPPPPPTLEERQPNEAEWRARAGAARRAELEATTFVDGAGVRWLKR